MQFAMTRLPLLVLPLAAASFARAQTPLVDVPITLCGVHIYTMAKINGQGPFPLNVDTGGTMGISSGLAKKLGIVSSEDVIGGGSGAKTIRFGKADALNVQIGGVEMKRLVGIITDDLGSVEAGIGPELFERFTVQLDYDRMRMRLYPKGSFPKGTNAAVAPLRFQRQERKPLVYLRVGKVAGWFLADTGGGVSLILQRNFWRKHGLDRVGKAPVRTIVGYGVGGPIFGRIGRGPTLEFASILLPDMLVSYSDMTQGTLSNPERDGLLGQRILRRFNVTFDYAHARMALTPNREFANGMPFSQTGLAGFAEGGLGYQVDYVIPGSPGARAGLRVGDVLVEIDGKIVDDRLVRKAFWLPAGTRLGLRVLRGDRTFATSMVLREVLE